MINSAFTNWLRSIWTSKTGIFESSKWLCYLFLSGGWRENISPPLGGRVLCSLMGENRRREEGEDRGIVGLFLGAVEAVCTSLTLPCYCLCTGSRLRLLLRGLSAFSPDNTQLCLTGDLRPVLVPPPGLHFKGKVQSKKAGATSKQL